MYSPPQCPPPHCAITIPILISDLPPHAAYFYITRGRLQVIVPASDHQPVKPVKPKEVTPHTPTNLINLEYAVSVPVPVPVPVPQPP
jgi:hypothetical protein